MEFLGFGRDDGEFADALDVFLARYGRRAEAWTIGSPTWAERGPGFWAQLANMAAPDVVAASAVSQPYSQSGERSVV